MLKNLALVATIASFGLASAATAATVTTYSASSAQSDTYASDYHSLWSKRSVDVGLGHNFHFDPSGKFEIVDDGSNIPGSKTATLSGNVVSANDSSSGFKLLFNYNDDLTAYGTPSFKNEQDSAAIQALHGDNIFMSLLGGLLVGFGDLEGANFTVSTMPVPAANAFATQIGTGSNNKNANYGLANWFFFHKIAGRCDNVNCDRLDGRQGDINIDLAPVPAPAAGLLLLAGIGALTGLRRAKK